MAVFLSPVGGAGAQFFDNNGNPLTGGKLYTYAAGTTTPLATYTSSSGVTANTNPVILDAAGRVSGSSEIWLTGGTSYKFLMKDSNNVTIATWDNIFGNGDPVFAEYVPSGASLLAPGPLTIKAALDDITDESSGSSVIGYLPPYSGSSNLTVEEKLAQTVSVKDFGAVGNGVADDTAAVQAALNYFANNQKKGVVRADGVYKITSGLTLNVTYVRLEAENATFNFSTLASGAAITITGKNGVTPYNQAFGGITGLEITGPGKSVSGAIGLLFSAANEAGPSHSSFYGVNVHNFEKGHVFRQNAYVITFYNSDVFNCTTASQMEAGYSNYGERIQYVGCSIYNNDYAVVNSNTAGAYHLISCSLDYNGVQVVVQDGRVFLNECHIEASNYATPPFITYPANGCTLTIHGGWILCTGTNTTDIFLSQTAEAQGGGIFVRDVFFNNLGSSVRWKQNIGRFELTNPISYNTTNNPQFASQYENLLIDGGFEGTSVYDAIITSDSAPITSRTSGSNISLTNSSSYARTGSKSLAATKTFGAGSAAGFDMFAPLSETGNLGTWIGYYKKPGSQTGTVYISRCYVNMQIIGGIPVIVKRQVVGTDTITFTSSAVDWTLIQTGEPAVHAPSWATHFSMGVNMDGIGAGSLYFDDFEFYQY